MAVGYPGWGYGGFYGYPGIGYGGFGYGYPMAAVPYGYGYGYGYPAYAYGGYPGFQYYGFGYGNPGFYTPGLANPLFGVGMTPLGVQSYLYETQILGRRSMALKKRRMPAAARRERARSGRGGGAVLAVGPDSMKSAKAGGLSPAMARVPGLRLLPVESPFRDDRRDVYPSWPPARRALQSTTRTRPAPRQSVSVRSWGSRQTPLIKERRLEG